MASARIDYGPTSLFNPDHVVLSEFVRDLVTVFWVGGNSNWNVSQNWTPSRVPNNDGIINYRAVVGSGNVTVDVPVELNAMTLDSFGGTLTLDQTMTVGDFHWAAGDLSGPNVLTITGQSTLATEENVNTGAGLVNQGTATWLEGDLTGTFNQQGFVNQGEFLIELTDNHNFQYVTNTTTGVIRHTGTARRLARREYRLRERRPGRDHGRRHAPGRSRSQQRQRRRLRDHRRSARVERRLRRRPQI